MAQIRLAGQAAAPDSFVEHFRLLLVEPQLDTDVSFSHVRITLLKIQKHSFQSAKWGLQGIVPVIWPLWEHKGDACWYIAYLLLPALGNTSARLESAFCLLSRFIWNTFKIAVYTDQHFRVSELLAVTGKLFIR